MKDGSRVSSSDVYVQYAEFIKMNGGYPVGTHNLKSSISKHLPDLVYKKARVGGKSI